MYTASVMNTHDIIHTHTHTHTSSEGVCGTMTIWQLLKGYQHDTTEAACVCVCVCAVQIDEQCQVSVRGLPVSLSLAWSYKHTHTHTHTRGLTESWPLSNRHQALSQVDGNMKKLSGHQTRGFWRGEGGVEGKAGWTEWLSVIAQCYRFSLVFTLTSRPPFLCVYTEGYDFLTLVVIDWGGDMFELHVCVHSLSVVTGSYSVWCLMGLTTDFHWRVFPRF